MNWLNIHIPILRSPEFIGCDPVSRATWLYVTAYACEQENGGVIKGCRGWKDRQWQQTCGVTLSEVDASEPVLFWEGEDLHIFAYPTEKEAEVKAKRIGGKKGGKKRASLAKQDTCEKEKTASSIPRSIASSSASSSASTEGNRKEKGIGKEVPPDPQVGKGEDLHIFAYPTEKEAEVKAKRIGGKKGGKKRASLAKQDTCEKEQKTASSIPQSIASSSASSSASTEGEGEGEGEWNRKEKGIGKEVPPDPQGGNGEVEENPSTSVESVIAAWNGTRLPKAVALNQSRRKTLNARLKESFWVENWKEGIEKADRSDFLRGANGNGWTATFDFFIKPDSLTKIIEGKYDNRKNKSNTCI